MNFKKYLDKVVSIFKSAAKENKATFETPAGDTALVIIDVQREFCDPKRGQGNQTTDDIAKRIKRLAPLFRKAGVPVYVVYSGDRGQNEFYQFKPVEGDTMVARAHGDQTSFLDTLQKDNRKSLLVCGFLVYACILGAALDARTKNLDVCLLSDLTGNDRRQPQYTVNGIIAQLKEKGVKIKESSHVLHDMSRHIQKVFT